MTIPEIRARLRAKAQETGDPELAMLADELRRRPPNVRARRPTSRKMTPQVQAEIMALAAKHPDWSNQDIAVAVGVNAGRVSETLNGYRQ